MKLYLFTIKDIVLAILHPIKYFKWLQSWKTVPKDGVNECLESYINNLST